MRLPDRRRPRPRTDVGDHRGQAWRHRAPVQVDLDRATEEVPRPRSTSGGRSSRVNRPTSSCSEASSRCKARRAQSTGGRVRRYEALADRPSKVRPSLPASTSIMSSRPTNALPDARGRLSRGGPEIPNDHDIVINRALLLDSTNSNLQAVPPRAIEDRGIDLSLVETHLIDLTTLSSSKEFVRARVRDLRAKLEELLPPDEDRNLSAL